MALVFDRHQLVGQMVGSETRWSRTISKNDPAFSGADLRRVCGRWSMYDCRLDLPGASLCLLALRPFIQQSANGESVGCFAESAAVVERDDNQEVDVRRSTCVETAVATMRYALGKEPKLAVGSAPVLFPSSPVTKPLYPSGYFQNRLEDDGQGLGKPSFRAIISGVSVE